MDRKKFIAGSLMLLVGGFISKFISACSSESDNKDGGGLVDPNADCLNAGTIASISGNHGHTLVVSKEDVSAGINKTYDITGESSHPHSLTITSAQFAQLAENNSIRVTSSNNSGHSHTVTVTCAA